MISAVYNQTPQAWGTKQKAKWVTAFCVNSKVRPFGERNSSSSTVVITML